MVDIPVDTDLVALGGSGASTTNAQAAVPLGRGQVVIYNASTRRYELADAVTEIQAVGAGIVLSPAAALDDWFILFRTGPLIVGGPVAVGESYVLSANGGAIKPNVDLLTNDWVTEIGRAISTTVIQVSIKPTGIQFA